MKNKDWNAWRQARHDELAGPDSWLGLVGLFWLDDEVSRVGSGEDCVVRLPSGPEHLGDLRRRGRELFWQPIEGEVRSLQTDRDGEPTSVEHGSLSFFVVDREGRLAARVRDRDWASSQPFAGLDYFPEDAAWRLTAEWETLDPPRLMEVPNVTGDLKSVEVRHQAVFDVDGQRVELLPMSEDERSVFFVFRDRTSGRETYGAGRFLRARQVEGGQIVLDFNRAYCPPCAFTPFATCPLPPPENWLPFPVTAGEKKYAAADH